MGPDKFPMAKKMNKRARTANESPLFDGDALYSQPLATGTFAKLKCNHESYQTFQSTKIRHISGAAMHSSQDRNSFFSIFPRCLFARICLRRPAANPSSPDESKTQQDGDFALIVSRRLIILVSLVVGLLACSRRRPYDYLIPGIPEWHWDHNVYITHSSDAQLAGNEQIALLAQVVSSRPLKALSDVSSRPNRAYARQWGMDYAQYNTGRPSYDRKACFDKIFVLNTILDKQNLEPNESSLLQSHTEKVRYDSILLLPPDSIVTNLDTNLFEAMLPPNRLVAIAGFTETKKLNSHSGIVIFNLRHKYADAVAKLWWDMSAPDDVSCGANNDLGMLLSAVATVMDPDEDFDDLIHGIKETSDGFVGNRMVKCIPPSVPTPRLELLTENLEESKTDLQKTADAVCYRYYPRCEVIVT